MDCIAKNDPDVTMVKIYFPEEGQIQVHQSRVCSCPPHQLAFIGMVEIVRVLEEYHNEYRNCSVASSRRTSRTPIWEPQSPKNVLLSWKMKSPVPPIQNQNLW